MTIDSLLSLTGPAVTAVLALALGATSGLAILSRRRALRAERLYRSARRAEAVARDDCTRLRQAIDSVPGGLVLLDRDERVVFASAGYGETYPGLAGTVTPGAPFPDVTSGGTMKRLRAADGPWEETLVDGRVLLVDERRTAEQSACSPTSPRRSRPNTCCATG
jgi:hypothetical protein